MNLAGIFTGGRKRRVPPAKTPRARSELSGYQRTYGEKDGRTVFEAQQIKAKRKKRK